MKTYNFKQRSICYGSILSLVQLKCIFMSLFQTPYQSSPYPETKKKKILKTRIKLSHSISTGLEIGISPAVMYNHQTNVIEINVCGEYLLMT